MIKVKLIPAFNLDIDRYFRQLSPNDKQYAKNYLQDVPEEFITMLDKVIEVAAGALGKSLRKNLYHALAVHINAFIEQAMSGQTVINPNLVSIKENYRKEYETAQKISGIISDYAQVTVPEEEVGYIALILAKLDADIYRDTRHVGILVVAHGNSTASSMVDFANRLLGVVHGRAIDMPLEANVNSVFDKAAKVAAEINQGKGIMVLHVVHKALLPNTELTDVYSAVNQ